jgi:2-keto-4-pentenoate hydratase/2-oxohepta-3-ene-1,7-dioic acid hydratase in catechol pathway
MPNSHCPGSELSRFLNVFVMCELVTVLPRTTKGRIALKNLTKTVFTQMSWTHLIRFVAKEDSNIYLGQLVDTLRDIGLDSFNGTPIKAYQIDGSIFDGKVTDKQLTVDRLLSPITREQCDYVRCVGLNYRDHAEEAHLELPEVPILFTKPRSSIIGPYPDKVKIPKCAQDDTSDYEAELCVVIGKTGRDIKEKDALNYVLGYTASNDISARKLQLSQSQWCFGKGLDNSLPIGPVLVSPRAIPDPQMLGIKAIYNGRAVQNGNTSDMIFNIRQQIAYFSQGTTLEAGSLIVTGTPAGIGFARNPKVVLEDGSDIRVEIDKIGTLINKVQYE